MGPPEVAVGIPADLLRRRPDIKRAERRIAQQSASIGIAITDLYPHFSLSGNVNWGSEKLSTLFSGDASGGAFGPSLRWDLLNYGRIVNNVQLQRQVFGELITSYRNTVLTANQEVEDSLVAFLRNQERVTELQASVDATSNALELVLIQYKEGETDFTGVFVMQRELVQLQERLAQAQGEVAESLIGVYKALGGGWEIRRQGCGRNVVQSGDEGVDEILLPPPVTPDTIPEPALLPQPLSADSVNTAPPAHGSPLMAESNLLED